jgi:hypothetical protein
MMHRMNFRLPSRESAQAYNKHSAKLPRWPLLFVAVFLGSAMAQAAIVLPDIVVTSLGSAYDGDLDYHVVGVNTSTSLGTASSSAFPGGSVIVGENVSVLIKPQNGYHFGLAPGYTDLRVAFEFLSAADPTNHDATPTFEFLDVQGGTIPSFTSIFLTTGETRIASRRNPSIQPSDLITFSALRVSWSQPHALTFDPMTFSGMSLFTTADPLDTTPYLTLVSVPEPSRALLLLVGMALTLLRRKH